MRKHALLLLLTLSFGYFFSCYGQGLNAPLSYTTKVDSSLQIRTNTLKIDVVGLPLRLLTANDGPYPRLSMEYERSFPRLNWLASVIDFEISRKNEEFYGRIGKIYADGLSQQRNFSLILGGRVYPFRRSEWRWTEIFFIEPRLGLTLAKTLLTPYTVADPLISKSRWLLLPRLRGGVSLPMGKTFGLEINSELLALFSLATETYKISNVIEVNVGVRS